MKQTVQIVLECESEIAEDILFAAGLAAEKRGKSINVISIEKKRKDNNNE